MPEKVDNHVIWLEQLNKKLYKLGNQKKTVLIIKDPRNIAVLILILISIMIDPVQLANETKKTVQLHS